MIRILGNHFILYVLYSFENVGHEVVIFCEYVPYFIIIYIIKYAIRYKYIDRIDSR